MIRYTICLILSIALISTFSCKKEKNSAVKPIDSPVVTYADYTMLKPGNYWIYQDYRLDSVSGASHALGTFDSDYVEKDTTINGKVYHKYCDAKFSSGSVDPQYDIYMLRDSLSYIVNSNGRIMFSSTDFSSIFRMLSYVPYGYPDTLIVTERMGHRDSSITVDAGTFTTSTFRQIYAYPSNYHPWGLTREYDHSYCKNIGLIYETTGFYESSPEIWERRLVRYHIQ